MINWYKKRISSCWSGILVVLCEHALINGAVPSEQTCSDPISDRNHTGPVQHGHGLIKFGFISNTVALFYVWFTCMIYRRFSEHVVRNVTYQRNKRRKTIQFFSCFVVSSYVKPFDIDKTVYFDALRTFLSRIRWNLFCLTHELKVGILIDRLDRLVI